MEDNDPILHGTVLTSLGLSDLSEALGQAGVASRIGESCHYITGRYLHLRQGEADLRLDEIAPAEYSVSGDAKTAGELNQLAQLISSSLQQLGIKHRFEIYVSCAETELNGYYHHDWPLS